MQEDETKDLSESLRFIRGKIEAGKHQEEETKSLLRPAPPPHQICRRDRLRANPQPCCEALYLQCSAGQLQLGGGGRALASLAQSSAALREKQPLHPPSMSPLLPSSVAPELWWLFPKRLGWLQEYLYPWEAALRAGRFPSWLFFFFLAGDLQFFGQSWENKDFFFFGGVPRYRLWIP